MGLLVAGIIVGTVGLPVVRKGVRRLAVHTVKGALAVSEGVKDLSQKVSREWTELVDDAKTGVKDNMKDKEENSREETSGLGVEAGGQSLSGENLPDGEKV